MALIPRVLANSSFLTKTHWPGSRIAIQIEQDRRYKCDNRQYMC